MIRLTQSVVVVAICLSACRAPVAQTGTVVPANAEPLSAAETNTPDPSLSATGAAGAEPKSQAYIRRLPKNIVLDQKAIWFDSAHHLDKSDVQWLAPLSFAVAGLFATDTAVERHVLNHQSFASTSSSASNLGVAVLAGTAGSMWLWGRSRQNDQMRETGLLAGEAMADAFLSTTLLKSITGRQRPLVGDGKGHFRSGGDSFPSDHAAVSWAAASVIAHEYPGPLTKVLAYGTATGVSVARVIGEKHFLSDAAIGSALGWYVGHQVFRTRSTSSDDDRMWGTFTKSDAEVGESESPRGSTYVPLDSWVYPAIDRLAALGYVQSGFVGLRPWTRDECARLVAEAEDSVTDSDDPEALSMYRVLAREFSDESAADRGSQVAVESIYGRVTEISGPSLRDGLHFAQTIINDDGRPYAEGFNSTVGASVRAATGPLAFYVRGEYQQAPSSPPLSLQARQAIAAADLGIPLPPGVAIPSVSRLVPVEAYVALNLHGYQFSFGKQSAWWGPGQGGPMLLSTNAEPITALRIDRTSPFVLPGFLAHLGPIRTEFFIGRLAGHEFIARGPALVGQSGIALNPQPYLHGEKLSLKPTPNLELSVSRTVIFGAAGIPITLHTFARSFFSQSTTNSAFQDPGDRRSAFDFTYRLPHLRDWVTIYADGFTDDQQSPIAYPKDSGWSSGIYLPRIPCLRKLDFRFEGVFTPQRKYFPGFFYFNALYRNGYTNDGQLLGSWIGRQGSGLQLWSTYWFSPKSKVQVNYRRLNVDRLFLQGGSLQDFSVRSEVAIREDLSWSGWVQREGWTFPLLAPVPRSNTTLSMQFTYWPHWRTK